METQLRISLTEIYIVKLQTVFLVQIFVSAQSGKNQTRTTMEYKKHYIMFPLDNMPGRWQFHFF